MRQTRRSFALTLLAAPVALGARLPLAMAQTGSGQAPPATPQPVNDLPDPKTFQPGDFIWPKKKGAVIPRSPVIGPPSKEQIAWEAERDRLLRQDLSQSGISPEAARRLKSMSYDEFARLYFAGSTKPADVSNRSLNIGGQTVFVGHVGILDADAAGIPYVVEATATDGLQGAVIRTPYADWLKSNKGMQVWHGRVRDLRAGVRKRIATEAMKQLGKPYAFFNFDLNDDSGLYCSKLAWMSVWRATSGPLRKAVAVDDDPNPRRAFLSWFSPKQLVNAKHIQLLHSPGDY